MSLMDQIKQRARENKKTIVLAEGVDPRVAKAAPIIVKEGIADVILLGTEEEIRTASEGADMTGVTCIDPLKSEKLEPFAQELYNLRKHKGVTIEKARELVKDNLYFATMLVQMGDADGMVAGALNTTAATVRPPLQIIKMAPGISTVSSCFVFEVPNKSFGKDGMLVFGDCGVVIEPNAEQLASIAISTAASGVKLCGMENPRVAMLSFSTKGSATHATADKVIEDTRIAKEIAPDMIIDGELQGDAALVPAVAAKKAPGSPVEGKADILVFPDINAGNICYKLVERLAGAVALGPIIQGLRKPVNDLSRGCSVEDVVGVAAITVVMAS